MGNFILSAFADEISENFDVQLSNLNDMGIEYVEIRGVDGKNIADLSFDEIKTVKQKLDSHNIKVSAIGSPIGKIKITDDFLPELEKFQKVLETSQILGTKYIRMFSFFIPEGENPDRYKDDVLSRWHKYVDAAKDYPVILLHENEKGIYGDIPERCVTILSSFASNKVMATFDPANFIQCGTKVYPYAFDALKPYIEYVHIKDADKSGNVVPAGYGIGNINAILSELKKDGFCGFISLEPHLGDFCGFSELEGKKAEKKPKSTIETFKIAYNALGNILKNI
ncbi:MAG: sugar phosphate isomerase/epimerase [Clostridia bacterium]|nr:sugar phosphate isomerase/epimerase [Clostridia bacterium]